MNLKNGCCSCCCYVTANVTAILKMFFAIVFFLASLFLQTFWYLNNNNDEAFVCLFATWILKYLWRQNRHIVHVWSFQMFLTTFLTFWRSKIKIFCCCCCCCWLCGCFFCKKISSTFCLLFSFKFLLKRKTQKIKLHFTMCSKMFYTFFDLEELKQRIWNVIKHLWIKFK